MLMCSMSVTLDGYIAGPGGEIDWTAPTPELFRFHTDRVRELDVHFCGRALYETMLYWEDPGDVDPDLQEFAALWQALPKVVFSSTLTEVKGNARLATGTPEEELARYAGQTGEVGGARLAGAFSERGLIDDYRLFVCPVVLGAGTPYFAPNVRLDLELGEQRTFGEIIYLRYLKRRA
jgi:dihydrofolate reductase